ncbi:ankyrin repeat and SAM domain-containing protein 3-like protein, partial [Aphelenchoides avenae]
MKRPSVHFSTSKPVEHESARLAPETSSALQKILDEPLPPIPRTSVPLVDPAQCRNRFEESHEYMTIDLFTAASLGLDAVKIALQSVGCSNDTRKNYAGWTPLMYASYLGHADTCEVLLKQLRVNVNDTNQMGQTALMLAASCGSAATADILIAAGANVNKQDDAGSSALHYATTYNHGDLAIMLLTAGADANLADADGMTPTLIACKVGNDDTVAALLNHNGDPVRCNKDGENGETLAADHPKVLQLLKS